MKQDFRVAEWTVQPGLNCVTRGSEVVRLEPKVMQVLLELSAHVGEVVPKEDLIRAVWPNTAVGDDVLIRCISELRHVFNDNARAPRVIQTISKMGYRLIASVETIADQPAAAAVAPEAPKQNPTAETPVAAPPDNSIPSTDSAPAEFAAMTTASLRTWVAVALAVLLLAVAGVWALRPSRGNISASSSSFKTIPFTSYPGAERQPAFSPDGNQIVFTWNGEEAGDSRNVYVKLIGSEIPLRLTHAAAEDMSPAWSPDGKTIAFVRRSLAGNGIYLVPAIGGPERKIYDLHCAIDWDDPGLSWSPDGKQLVFPDGKSESNPSSIFSLSLDTLAATQLTHPNNSWDGDFSPEFSPDGQHIAFIRGTDVGSRAIYVMSASGDGAIALTPNTQRLHGLAWTGDSNGIVYSSNDGGTAALWRVPASGGQPQRLPFGSEKAFTPAISASGDRLAYSQGADNWSLMRIDMKAPRTPAVRLISSNEQDSAPKFSHDGKYVAFQSLRSGAQEIWVTSADSAGPVKLTSFNGPLTGSPSWSPDDTQIAFDSRVKGQSHIFVMSARGGVPRQLTDGDFNDIIPNWSADGKWIYFSSRRNGSWEIWKASVESGTVQQVTKSGGFCAQESPDGKWLYLTKYDQPGLWRMATSGGPETKVLDSPPPGYWAYFSVSPTGVYFLSIQDSLATVRSYDPARGTTSQLYTLARRPALFSGLSVSPDARWILYTDAVSRDGDIVLVENFR